MKHISNLCISVAVLSCALSAGAGVPWQDPTVNSINREEMTAHFIPFINEKFALESRNLPADTRYDVNPAAERRISLDGKWKFRYFRNALGTWWYHQTALYWHTGLCGCQRHTS